jgi:hypothetical protein
MNRSKFLYCWVLMCCPAAIPSFAHGPGPHVHGVATLTVAVDGNRLTLDLESPLDNLLGFEHLPRTEKEEGAVRDMAQRLNRAESLFVPTPAARCNPVSVKLESPMLQPEKPSASDGHADLDGEFVFRCERPEDLRDVEVQLFDGFPNMRQIDVQVAASRGQTAAKLSPERRRIAW